MDASVLAYITAYEDAAAFHRCLELVLAQSHRPARVLVVDNSAQPLLAQPPQSVVVEHHPENIGVGGGLAIATRQALTLPYDFLWLLDQDSQPAPDCLETLLRVYRRQSQRQPLGIVAPQVQDGPTGTCVGGAVFQRFRFVERQPVGADLCCDAPITSGSLVAVAAACRVALPRADLFIDGVDLDYGVRLRRAGLENLITPETVLRHELGSPLKVSFLGQPRFVQNYSALRAYYFFRNHTYLSLRFAPWPYRPVAALYRLWVMVKAIVSTILYRDDKFGKVRACVVGTAHGFLGRLGKLGL